MVKREKFTPRAIKCVYGHRSEHKRAKVWDQAPSRIPRLMIKFGENNLPPVTCGSKSLEVRVAPPTILTNQ